MLADEIYKLMGVDPKVPLAERINKIGKGVADVAKEIPGEAVKQVGAIAKEVAKAPIRAVMTPVDLVSQVATGKALPPLDMGPLGEAKSYGRQQEDDIKAGMDPVVAGLKNMGQGAADLLGVAGPMMAKPPVVAPKKSILMSGKVIDPGDLQGTVKQHIQSGEMLKGSMNQSQLESMQTGLIEHTKRNIVDGVAERFPKISEAVSKLDPKAFKTFDDFSGAVDKIVKGVAATALVPMTPQDESKIIKTVNKENGTVTIEKKKSILDRIKNLDISNEWSIHPVRQTQVDTMLEAIAQNETSVIKGAANKYKYRKHADPDDPKNFDNGKYQVTTNELATYAKRFLGREVTDWEFLASPDMQERYMKNKINFMIDEGLTPGEILASHRGGLPNWGNKEKMNEKRRAYPEYIKSGVDKYLTDLKAKDPVAYEEQMQVYRDKITK